MYAQAHGAPHWFVDCRTFLLEQLGNVEPITRHLAAKALSVLVCNSVILSKTSWAKSTVQALETTLVQAAQKDGDKTVMGMAADNNASPAALASRAGGLLALTYIFEALPPKKKALVHHAIVYDAARETRQPIRTWVLHAWGSLLRQLRHSRDFGKFVQPTLALIDAHLLCELGSTCTGTACNSTPRCARLLQIVISHLHLVFTQAQCGLVLHLFSWAWSLLSLTAWVRR